MNFKYEIRKVKKKFCLWFARKFPYISLWCFIVVFGDDGNCPCKCYGDKYLNWKIKYKLKDF